MMQPGAQRVGLLLTALCLSLASGCHAPRPKASTSGSVTPVTSAPAKGRTVGLLTFPKHYPEHWFAPVPTNGAPAWEVLPQAAKPGEVILSKRNELGLLSNFAPTPFTFHDQTYASLEGFWQMMKYPEDKDDPRATFAGITWPHTRAEVAGLTAFDAKHAGDAAEKNMKAMGLTWVTFEGRRIEYREPGQGEFYQLIAEATRAKVRQNPEVRKVLLSTGNLLLKPDHHQATNSPPAWRYHEILMQIRAELQMAPR